MNRCLFLLVFAAISSHLLLASDKPSQQDAVNRMQQAVAKTNIFELPSFVMKATVQVDNRGKMVDGTYQLLWNGPDQWREEITFPGYREVQVGGKGTASVQRNTELMPIPIYHLRQALPFGSNAVERGASSLVRLDLSRRVVKKQRERNEHGSKLTCFEMEDEQKYLSEICVSESTGTITNHFPFHIEDDLQPIAGKVFPRVFSTVENGKTLAKVSISELTTPGQFAPDAFTPPAGFSPQVGCMNPASPYLIKRVAPEYPTRARLDRWRGRRTAATS